MNSREIEKNGRPPNSRPPRLQNPGWGRWLIILLLAWLLLIAPQLWSQFFGDQNSVRIPYSAFLEQVENDNVVEVELEGQEIRGDLKTPAERAETNGEPTEYSSFVTYLPGFGDDRLLSLLEEKGVQVSVIPVDTFSWGVVIANALPFLLLVAIGYFFLARMQSSGQSILGMGKSRARLYDRTREATTFDDVAGAQGPKRELEEIVEFLKAPDRFQRLGGEMPKGLLLVGPPGTGKTLLARAVAGEAEVPFFSITGSDFMEMFVGVGASRVRDLFREAKQTAPSIIFIDELDSIGRRRGAGLGGGHDEREQTLNQMLSELDGFEPSENVIVIAATNRPDILDPALLRPGRFDRQISVDLPTMQDRAAILKIHAKGKPFSKNVDLEKVARGTPGFSGADLENLLNEAALIAARKDKSTIDSEDIEESRDKVMMGLARENLMFTEEERQLLAYHEAGHAVLAAILPNADPIHKVTIVPRGRALGVTQQLPDRDRYLYSREYLLDRLSVMMGGRAAESLIFDTATSGAENDLKQATYLARKMVLNWGMSENLKHIALGDESQSVFLGETIAQKRNFSEETAREVDEEVNKILEEAFSKATKTLQENRKGLDRLVDALLEKEEVSGEQVPAILDLEEESFPTLN